jgi:hypothetical protein
MYPISQGTEGFILKQKLRRLYKQLNHGKPDKKGKKGNTREIPRLRFVHIDIGDHGKRKATTTNLALEVVENQLLVRGAESKPRRPAPALSPTSHPSPPLSLSLSAQIGLKEKNRRGGI